MPDLEKAIRVLEGNYKNSVLRHNGELITVNELLALLHAQEPRVMTLEEFQETGYNPKWLEFKDGKLGKWTLGYAGLDIFFDDQMPGYLSVKLYGRTWRCWTSRPTDEQREAAKWK